VRSESRCVDRDEDGRPVRIQGAIVDVTAEMAQVDRARRSEETLRTFVDGIPGIPWLELVDGEPGTRQLVFIGEQVREALGYTPEELIAEPGHALRMIHPADRGRIEALFAHHDRTLEPFWAEYRVMRRDGRVIWLRSQGLASRDDRGRLLWHGVSYDVSTEHDEAEPAVPPELIWLPGRG
jgi:PAS domain S-box-containing protein